MIFNQAEFDVRCEWGRQGIVQLAPSSRAVVIVDVLSFSTCVEIAASRGAAVFPYRWKDDSALTYAESIAAELASWNRRLDRPSLSPASLEQIPTGTRLVLPSPNGATLSLQTQATPTLAGCLRNSRAIATALLSSGAGIAIVPAGEQWPDGSLRPAFEDWIAAGAIISHLPGRRSPEAAAALAAFERVKPDLKTVMQQCSSGKELAARGFSADVNLAAQLDVSSCVPRLVNGAFCQQE